MKSRKQAHCVYYCQYHLVLVTKYRRQIFNAGIQAYLSDRLREIRQYYPELEFVEIQHAQDHLHLLVVIPPKMAVGKAVGIIKANTSKRMRRSFRSYGRCIGERMAFGQTGTLCRPWVWMRR
jgi:putative transposase